MSEQKQRPSDGPKCRRCGNPSRLNHCNIYHCRMFNVMIPPENPIGALDDLAKEVHQINVEKGFWEDRENKNFGEMVALMHSELSEALEAHRKDLKDDKLTHRKGIDVELADCLIRIMDYCGAYDVPIGDIVREKINYNKSRPFKHGKKY